ncbi:MAG: hypothetical protein QMC13_01350, partial [Colwellia sp.]
AMTDVADKLVNNAKAKPLKQKRFLCILVLNLLALCLDCLFIVNLDRVFVLALLLALLLC